ncbi:hypothetical protein H2248_011867 [Termitomyces sp. 'cryptogamus']|nr:hypothetical protein H2248_011867 [Termitomyces sp. 'cryptogamus']
MGAYPSFFWNGLAGDSAICGCTVFYLEGRKIPRDFGEGVPEFGRNQAGRDEHTSFCRFFWCIRVRAAMSSRKSKIKHAWRREAHQPDDSLIRRRYDPIYVKAIPRALSLKHSAEAERESSDRYFDRSHIRIWYQAGARMNPRLEGEDIQGKWSGKAEIGISERR